MGGALRAHRCACSGLAPAGPEHISSVMYRREEPASEVTSQPHPEDQRLDPHLGWRFFFLHPPEVWRSKMPEPLGSRRPMKVPRMQGFR